MDDKEKKELVDCGQKLWESYNKCVRTLDDLKYEIQRFNQKVRGLE